MEKILKSIIHYSLFIIIFFLPLFFLPTTQEFFITNKLYLLIFGSLLLLLISNIKYFFSKKITWQSLPFDMPLILFLLTIALSIIINSPNKIQALLNPNFGFVLFLSLTILYFYLSRYLISADFSRFQPISTILSIITIIFFFQPFKNINLPQDLQFLKNPLFTPVGDQIDLAVFLGFFVVYQLIKLIKEEETSINKKYSIIHYSLLFINLLALSLTLYNIFKPIPTDSNRFQPIPTVLPPFRLSWYAAVDILKNPLTAIFGVGVDNFASIFTKVKDIAYNQSNLWQINFFNYSRSALLHIFTETGLFGLLAFLILLGNIFKTLKENPGKNSLFIIIYSLLIIVILPSSLISWFLFFVALSLIKQSDQKTEKIYDFSEIAPFYIGFGIIWLLLISAGGYFIGRSYLAEVYFKKFLIGFNQNKGVDAYNNLRQSIILNPYNEQARINFSQLNLIIANNLASNLSKKEENEKEKQQIEQDRQNISQAIQTAISEAKAAVSLNPQKANNWANLAEIYRNIINTAQGADTWTISAYQRAIFLDPQNPIYRLNLGGVYYSLGSYEDAKNMFQQAVVLKPDWPNAYYNLAWASHQKQDYEQAVNAMEGVLKLLDPIKNKDDYNKAKKELEDFKKKVSEKTSTEEQSQEATKTSENLNLPTPIPTTNQPKIELPKEASPEAK